MTDIVRIESKIKESLINFVKFSNIDYKKYIDLEEKLRTFENFISHIINAKIKKIKKNNFDSLFKNIDLYLEEKFGLEQEVENTNLFLKFFNYVIGKDDNEKEKKDKNVYHEDNI